MTNPQKRKGSDFERLAVEILNTLIKDAEFKKIPGSGAIGTILDEPLLTSDLIGRVKSVPRGFKVECKVGYNPSANREIKSFRLEKLWLDKLRKEADASFSIPVLLGKFSGARDGVKVFVTMDVEVFAQLINHITKLQETIDGRQDNQDNGGSLKGSL